MRLIYCTESNEFLFFLSHIRTFQVTQLRLVQVSVRRYLSRECVHEQFLFTSCNAVKKTQQVNAAKE